jgi:hypothetical protein
VDREGWNNSKKVEAGPQLMAQGQVDLQTMDEDMVREAKVNLGKRDMKRKNKHPPSMRKSKRRRLEKLTGWGESSIQQKDVSSLHEDLSIRQEDLSSQQEDLSDPSGRFSNSEC